MHAASNPPLPGRRRLRPGTLAESALQRGELLLEQQNLRGSPGCVPTRDPGGREDPGGEGEGETEARKSWSSWIGQSAVFRSALSDRSAADALRVRPWRVPAAQVPAGGAARDEWLLGWWEPIDAWVARKCEAGAER
ncbi:hypothetical protein KDL01_37720 [Actinospica durhamensis]|uniref:Uncharacterized protein n=1 Tax=Actinospica durhamensis TaxID=1508375 RepID=A0A941IWC9_9ACTN|nr:hypothetical protein [Actinospica durhamensis]MBR7839066.1 hypothetical protein [Actinospica durhamensis]